MNAEPSFPYEPGQAENTILNSDVTKPCDPVVNLGSGGVLAVFHGNQGLGKPDFMRVCLEIIHIVFKASVYRIAAYGYFWSRRYPKTFFWIDIWRASSLMASDEHHPCSNNLTTHWMKH